MSFEFPKSQRINSKKEIDDLLQKGEVIFLYPFKSYILTNNHLTNRILISVPKKKFKRAVDRNYLKRRIRESYRLLNPSFTSHYNILVVYISEKNADYKFIYEKIQLLLQKIDSLSKNLP